MGEWQDGSAAQDARVPSGVVMDMRIVRRWTPEPSKTKPSPSSATLILGRGGRWE